MSAIVCVHIGGCGNSLGQTFYNVISHEHGLTPSGNFIGNSIVQLQQLGVYYTFGQRLYAKAIIADTDQRTYQFNRFLSPYGEMFAPHNIIIGRGEGAGNNFGKAYHTEGKDLLHSTLDAIRHEAERSDSLQGLQLCHSIGGGTGSGFTSLLLEYLATDYPTKTISSFSVVPSSKVSNVVVEPYNSMLALRHLTANTHLTIMIDNEALYNVSTNVLHLGGMHIQDLNCIVGQTMAGITSSLRFPGQLNSSLRKIYTNMCPFPSLHLLVPGFSPLIPCLSQPYTRITVDELVYQIFSTKNCLASIDFKKGKLLTLAAMFRGALSPRQIDIRMKKARSQYNNYFSNWIPNNIKWSLCDIAPVLMPKSVSFLCNTTSIRGPINRIKESAGAMLKRKAYLHWFTGEGVNEDDFHEAYNNLTSLLDDYKEISDEVSIGNIQEVCGVNLNSGQNLDGKPLPKQRKNKF